MIDVLKIVLLVLAGLSILAAVIFILKGLGARSSASRQAYNVGQAEAKRSSQVNWIRASLVFLAGLIFIGVYAVIPVLSRPGASLVPTSTAPAITTEPVSGDDNEIDPVEVATVAPAPTQPLSSPSPEPTSAPTSTVAPSIATVSSGVGVWLRGSPSTSGEQLEWLLDGSTVTLLPGQETADDLLWQQVRTDAGVEGWVASDFLVVSEPAP